MKLHVQLDGVKLAVLKEEKAADDHVGATVSSIKEAGLKLGRRQHMLNSHLTVLGEGDEVAVKKIRQLPNVFKVTRADGSKMKVK